MKLHTCARPCAHTYIIHVYIRIYVMYAWGRGDGEGGGRERGRDLKDTALQVNCERAPESEVRRLAILDLYILHTHMHIYIYI